MVRYHLRCKNSLLLLKCKFLLRVGDKKFVFLTEFTFFFYFIFISFVYTVILVFSSLNGVTLWKLIFPFLVPHWILVVTIVCTAVLPLVHGSFPIWTLLCGVYRPYGLIFFTNFNCSITAICFGDAYSLMYQWATNGTSKIVSYSSVVLRLVRLLILYGMFCELPMLHC